MDAAAQAWAPPTSTESNEDEISGRDPDDARDEPPRMDPTKFIGKLVESRIIDVEHCAAQTGESFASIEQAAAHFAAHGDYSPHPMMDVHLLPGWVRYHLRQGRIGSLFRYLRRSDGSNQAGLSFDVQDIGAAPEEIEAHRGGVLGVLVERSDQHTTVPGRPHLLLADASATITSHARTMRRDRALRKRRRTTSVWDQPAEDEFRREWEGVAPPTADGVLVSVVMAVRNRAAVVGDAIKSVLDQDLDDWELILVDDGSTDDTPQVLSAWADRDSRIHIVSQEWRGVSAARNRGLERASGRFVAFLDSDNAWRPDYLRLAAAAMDGRQLRAAYAGLKMQDPDDPEATVYRAYRGSRDDLMLINHIDLNVLMVERELALEVGGFSEDLKRWVDHDFALKLSAVTELDLLPIIAVDYEHSMDLADRITTTESESWQFVVLGRHWIDWDNLRREVPQRVPGRVSVLIPTWNDSELTTRAVERVLDTTRGLDVEVVVLDNGSKADVARALCLGVGILPNVRLERLPRNLNFALGCNLAFARSTGEFVVFLNNDTAPRPGWLPPLIEMLDNPDVLGVQPLLQYPDDTIQAAGTVFPAQDFLPIHFLVGHPPEDALRLTNRRFRAVTAAALAMRARDVSELRGFDPIFMNGSEDIDLCLRAAQLREGHFLLEPRSQVTHYESQTKSRGDKIGENRRHFMNRWRGRLPEGELQRWTELGFQVAHLVGEDRAEAAAHPLLVRPRLPDLDDGTPCLRWGIKYSANGGLRGDTWGDTHFVSALSGALEQRGQQVVTYRHSAHHSRASAFDDVALCIRGLDKAIPSPGKLNVLWVISHPDAVSTDELRAFDMVFAASDSWAASASARSGRDVVTLLQPTSAKSAPDPRQPLGDGAVPVFVGITFPDRERPIVHDAVAAGLPVQVHGSGWDGRLPPGTLASEYVDNDDLLRLYRSHGLVLADHWGDMARHGFLANRLFDAVSSGARVICDDVPGVEIFDGAVQVYRDVDELKALYEQRADAFPSEEKLHAIAQRVASEHSFQARADELLAHVTRARAAATQRG